MHFKQDVMNLQIHNWPAIAIAVKLLAASKSVQPQGEGHVENRRHIPIVALFC